MKGLVSVVIPTRNRAGFLQNALGSVLAQRDVFPEIIVVDDGSEDETQAMLERLHEPRLRVLRHQVSRGVAAARNAGLAVVSTPWTAFLDDDDFWAPEKLRSQLQALRSTPDSKWCCTGAFVVGLEGEVRHAAFASEPRALLPRSLRSNVIPGGGSGVMASTTLLHELGGFDETLRALADWDLWIRLARRAPLAVVRRPLLAYTMHDAAMSSATVGLAEELARVVVKHSDLRAEFGVRRLPPGIVQWMAKRDWQMKRRRSALGTIARAGDPLLFLKFAAGRIVAGLRSTLLQRLPSYGAWRSEVASWRTAAARAFNASKSKPRHHEA